MQALIESLALVALLLISLFWKTSGKRTKQHQKLVGWFRLSVQHPAMAYLLIGLLGFAASALLAAVSGLHPPHIHDEFSYLLQADTFAHGRVTNPPHPLWQHFETFHVIQQPTYASKYPPGQGLILAFGQVVFGHPIVGVWLSIGLACAAICWMIAGWCPLRWAWFGGLVAVVRLVFSGPAAFFLLNYGYWSQSYWGGAVAALGGALVFGALPRIIKKQKKRDALWLALGLAIMANSRPLEGLVVSLPVAVILGIWIVKARNVSWTIRCRQVVIPVMAVLLPAATWMGYYNFQVTGHPFLMPYQVHEATYAITPIFIWQSLKPEPHYNHPCIRDYHVKWECDWYRMQQSFSGWLKLAIWKFLSYWMFYVGLIFTPVILTLPKIWHRPSVKLAVGVWALLLVVLLTGTNTSAHYAAPATSLAFLFVVECLRQTRRLRWDGRPVGRTLVTAVLPVLLASAVALFVLPHYLHPSLPTYRGRVRILHYLEKLPGRHLVMVPETSDDVPREQFVFNQADIDHAKVVWAWQMGGKADRELFSYFRDRHVWLLRTDRNPPFVVPYHRGPNH